MDPAREGRRGGAVPLRGGRRRPAGAPRLAAGREARRFSTGRARRVGTMCAVVTNSNGRTYVPERLTVGVAARLSRYLQVLTQAKKMGKDRISSQEIAEYTNINATQIRRDLSSFGRFGKRGVGYSVDSLLSEIRKILRTQGQHNIALVGAGRLGAAIASSPIFAEHGITIAAVFDKDPAKVGDDPRRRLHQPARRARRDRPRPEHRRRRPRRPGGRGAGRGRAAGRGGRQDRLQLLAGPDRHAVGRAGAHLEPGRRAPLRPVLPPHLSAASAGEAGGGVAALGDVLSTHHPSRC